MFNWIFSNQVVNVVVVGITSFFLYCGPNTDTPQEVCLTAAGQPTYIHPAVDTPVVVDAGLERSIRFQRLVSQWRAERGATSSITAMAMCDAYQKIIGMGPDVTPLIIAQLRSEADEPDQWFWALQVITGVDPIAEEDRGDFLKMSQSWINWAESAAYGG
jgi:hypothetical protein